MSTFIKSMTVSIDSNSTLSEAIQMGELGYSKVMLEIPTMSTAAAIRVYGSGDGSTYRYLHESDPTTAVVGVSTMVFASSTNGYIAEMQSWAPYMKLQVTGTVCASADFKVFAVINQ